jgi:signal transduction histidine kinase
MSKYKLYVLISCILGIIIIVGGFFMLSYARGRLNQSLIDNYAKQELSIVSNISKLLELDISTIQNQLTLMSENPLIADGDTEECTTEIKYNLSQTQSELGNVGRVNKNGVFTCSLNPLLINTRAEKLGPYITDIFNDPAHAPVMSRTIPVPGVKGFAVALHVPVFNEKQEFDGTLGGAIYLSDLQNKYLKDVVFAKRGFVALIDDDGTILYHYKSGLIGTKATSTVFKEILAEVKQDRSGTKQFISTSDGLEKISSYAPVHVVPGRIWVVLATVPISDAQVDLKEIGLDALLTRVWILISFIVIIALVGFMILSQKLVFKPLKEIQEMKSDFVSLVSHQLKTPVAQIKGYVENMLDGLAGRTTKKQREYLGDMLNVANKNSKLIDDLLNISRIERGMLKVEIASQPLNELLEDVISPLRTVAATKGVLLEEKLLDGPVRIEGDPVKTREALRNIIDNAIKFTDAHKKVSISAIVESEYVVVTVADQGQGIDPDVQNELFEKKRVWSGKVKASGAGLGLFLSKQFIELTGGIIDFKTEAGKGTTFVIKLLKSKS